MTQSNLPETESDFGYGQLFAILLRRKFWLLGVFCSVLAIAIPIALKKEPTYQSSIQLLIEPLVQEKQQRRSEENQFTESNIEVDYTTQINLMRSSQLIQRAVNLLQDKYPTIKVEEIREFLTITRIIEDETETKIVKIDYISKDPIQTQEVLKAIQKIYQNYNLEQQKQRLVDGLSFIDNQLVTAANNVNKAERSLEEFRENQNLIDPLQEASNVGETLTKIEQERQAVRAQYQETLARYNSLQKQLNRSTSEALTSSRLSQSPRYQSLLDELQKTELALAERRTRFTDADPSVQKLMEQQSRQYRMLQEEGERVLGRVARGEDLTSNTLLTEGQLGENDLDLSQKLAEAQSSIQGLQARDRSLAQTEQKLRTKINTLPQLMARYERMQPEVQLKRDTLQKLMQARQDLGIEIARGGFKWQVVEAPLPGEQIGPNTKQDIMLAVVVGLFLGGIAAFGREFIDDGVHTSDQLKRNLTLPFLGIIPELPKTRSSSIFVNLPFRKSSVTEISTSHLAYSSAFRESLDLIYKNIQLVNAGRLLKSLAVTSALSGEGKSTLVMGLALTAARLQQRVLLIDTDLRFPTLHRQLNLPNEEGLSTLLADDNSIPNPQHVSLLGSNIDVLTAGPIPLDPVKLLSSPRMKKLMASFEQTYSLILLDSPPILGMVDAMEVASFASGVIMVGRMNRVSQSQLTEAIAMLSKLNAIGVVANGASGSSSPYISYKSQYNNSSLEKLF
ncbi:MAG TPA: capsular biosynthesis protein [Cyanobacteria bacterium UBA11149]|nr:capsular biosynthesis protein [Cyanobacteria bacterium UBA11367]HBE56174.1 capsular biosynthesis protein [Cyanobacteria bacterium UBA11366]HBK62195.1 capsular biosynthesis protein [Cyanobacteria bacterium UBA11166]HBR73896.1 capsular biosynthesis protein [Cyanobacteria bacterium UBA11159]HBS70219.1 capsular biosynthesis protein [Cyanobacteria bacterium UBA11153]HBW90852.1 capsular biosynthesis protein [Cyanobacteria bacterium UBA11149]HCA96346.1 capsular biosynthesis protein [Cyanobacteria